MLATGLAALVDELNRLANAQFATPEFRHLLSIQFTPARARCYAVHLARYQDHRRDCWGYVQGAAPLPVKRLVWQHESDELINDPRADTDHSTLAAREAEALGMTPEEFAAYEIVPGATAAFYAWVHLSRDRPWLEAFTVSSMLERRNDDSVIEGGGLSHRLGHKIAQDLGLPLKNLQNSTVHMAADVEHARLLEWVAERYATTDEAQRAMLRAAHDTYVVDCAFRGALAEALEDITE
ncbi:MAG TPA: iron-containing redox enzyme family protein [Chloroflexota bacterium]|jgi:hypothetical protein